MTRLRSSAPGVGPARRLSAILLLVASLVGGCGGSAATASPSTAPTDGPSAPVPIPTEQPTTSPGPATPEPRTPEPASAVPETPEPATPAPETAEPTDDGSSASSCTGNDENVMFFRDFAAKVPWDVYCPSLPRGWFVGTGQWRQADGGRLEVSYRGPDGAGLMLQEGSFCPGDGDCVPPGEERGPAAFGDRDGTLIATADGWAVVVDRGERPAWLLTLTGVGESAARSIAADLVLVEG